MAEGVGQCAVTVFGKIHELVKATGDRIEHGYDAGGNRTSKQVHYSDTTVNTYYIRDAARQCAGGGTIMTARSHIDHPFPSPYQHIDQMIGEFMPQSEALLN